VTTVDRMRGADGVVDSVTSDRRCSDHRRSQPQSGRHGQPDGDDDSSGSEVKPQGSDPRADYAPFHLLIDINRYSFRKRNSGRQKTARRID
jgi:hypothetical protein